MDNFLEELEQITQAYAGTSSSDIIPSASTTAPITNTPLQNPENPETWGATTAESQDYQALNQEIETDRTTAKMYIVVGSGLSALGANAFLGNAVLEATYNPVGYMTFSGVIAVALLSAGVSGSRLNGRTFYASPWLLSAVGASAGVVGGAYAVSRPYFEDQGRAARAYEAITAQIREIEVKPQHANIDISGWVLGIAAFMAITFIAMKK